MVPTIYPLETLHNSLSLRQVNEFLTAVCRSCESHVQSTAGTGEVGLALGKPEQSRGEENFYRIGQISPAGLAVASGTPSGCSSPAVSHGVQLRATPGLT